MKTITLDYDLYQKELTEARKSGHETGVYAAIGYIKDPEGWNLRNDSDYKLRKMIDDAIKAKEKHDN